MTKERANLRSQDAHPVSKLARRRRAAGMNTIIGELQRMVPAAIVMAAVVAVSLAAVEIVRADSGNLLEASYKKQRGAGGIVLMVSLQRAR